MACVCGALLSSFISGSVSGLVEISLTKHGRAHQKDEKLSFTQESN